MQPQFCKSTLAEARAPLQPDSPALKAQPSPPQGASVAVRCVIVGTLGAAQELSLHVRASRRDAVVPFWMERIAFYVERRHLLLGDPDALGIGVGIEFAADFETGFRRGVCDQFDGHEEAHEAWRASSG